MKLFILEFKLNLTYFYKIDFKIKIIFNVKLLTYFVLVREYKL